MSSKEANALNRIWYGATSDGSFDAAQSAEARSGKSLGKNQLWWTFTKSTAIGSQITSASSYGVCVGAAGRQLRRRRQHGVRRSDHERLDECTQQMARARLRRRSPTP